jgi:hypothetical protein
LIVVALAANFEQFLIEANVMSFAFGVWRVFFRRPCARDGSVARCREQCRQRPWHTERGGHPTADPSTRDCPIFSVFGQPKTANYDYLFFAAAVFAVLGAVTIIPIKKVR